MFKSADLDCLDLFCQKRFIDGCVNHIFFFFRKVSLFKQKLTSILLHFHLFHWEICRIFFYKIDSAFFLSGQSINSGLLMFGSQAWGSVCHFTSVLHGFKSSWHIVLFIYHPGCRNKKTIWSFRGLVSVGDMDFITPKLEKKVYSYGWVPGFSNYGFRTNAQHPLFQILMRPLSLTARVHKPVDLWDITFCTRRFWDLLLLNPPNFNAQSSLL